MATFDVQCACGYPDLYDLLEDYVDGKSFEPFVIHCPKCGIKIRAKKELLIQEAGEKAVEISTRIKIDIPADKNICDDCNPEIPSCNNCLGS